MTMNPASGQPVIPEFHVGDRLGKAREAAGLTQAQLADEFGSTRSTVSRWETGKGVKRSVLLAYSMRTGVPVEWLEFGKYTPWDLNPEPNGFGFSRRRNFMLAAVPLIGTADISQLLAA